MTAVNASSARPQAPPAMSALSTDDWSSPLIRADWRRIQNSIQVTTAAARSIVVASKICSYGSWNAPTVE